MKRLIRIRKRKRFIGKKRLVRYININKGRTKETFKSEYETEICL